MAKEFHFNIENPERARWAYLALSGNQSDSELASYCPLTYYSPLYCYFEYKTFFTIKKLADANDKVSF